MWVPCNELEGIRFYLQMTLIVWDFTMIIKNCRRIYLNLIKKNRETTRCNRLDLDFLRFLIPWSKRLTCQTFVRFILISDSPIRELEAVPLKVASKIYLWTYGFPITRLVLIAAHAQVSKGKLLSLRKVLYSGTTTGKLYDGRIILFWEESWERP